MRRVIGFVLVGLGAFLLLLAPLAKFYVAPQLAVAPLGCTGTELCQDGVSLSPSAGLATTLFDPATLSPRSNVALTSVQRVKPDVDASTGGSDKLTVYESFQEVVDSDKKLVDASTERIAFNGNTSAMIDCCKANENGTPITDFSGIAPFKFPFGTKQQTYQYFDGTLAKALPMEFKGTDTVNGLAVYKFVQTIPATQYAELEVPGSLVGTTDASLKAPRFYSNTRTVWVEPTTGVVVKGQEQQKQTLRGADGTDKLTLIEATLAFTPANVSNSVKTAEDGKKSLDLIQKTLPIVALVLGLLLLGLGIFLLRRRSSAGGHSGGSATVGGSTAAPVSGSSAPTVSLDDVMGQRPPE